VGGVGKSQFLSLGCIFERAKPKKRQQKAHAFVGGRKRRRNWPSLPLPPPFKIIPSPTARFLCAIAMLLFAFSVLKLRRRPLELERHRSATGSTTERPSFRGPFSHPVSQFTFNAKMGPRRRQRVSPMDGVFRARLGKKGGRKTLFTFFRSSLAIRAPLWHGALALCDPLVCAVCLLASCRAEIPAILRAKGRWDDANGRLECFGPDNGEN